MQVYQKHAVDDAKLLIKFHWPYMITNNTQVLSHTDQILKKPPYKYLSKVLSVDLC